MSDLRQAIATWARDEPDVRVMLETGAWARGEHDALSDFDIELHCQEPQRWLADTRWFESFACVWAYQAFDALDFPTRLVLYEGGQKVDFALLPVTRLERGEWSLAARAEVRVWLDKDDVTTHRPHPTSTPLLLTPDAFRATRAEFWMEAWSWAKYLVRHDFWHAKIRDNDTKRALLQLIEWHALAQGRSPRHAGHFVSHWTDEATGTALPGLWSGWEDAWQSLQNSVELFARLEHEVASALNLSLDSLNAAAIRADIARLRSLSE